MKKVNILYVGRHAEIMEIVVRLINKNEAWMGFGALTDEAAFALAAENNVDILLLGCGIEEEEEAVLRAFFREKDPATIIIQHYGGGSGLLSNEIMEALYYREKSLSA